jgi:hypothetical protein
LNSTRQNKNTDIQIVSYLNKNLKKTESKKYNTNQIIETIASICIDNHYDSYLDFETFDKAFMKENWKGLLSKELFSFFDLNITIKKRIYSLVNGLNKMPFDREFILKNYEFNEQGKEYIVYPSLNKKPKRLLVLFSGNGNRKTYNRYSWYWDINQKWEQDTIYLFINDTSNHWYVGTEDKPEFKIYQKIINSVMSDFNISNEFVYCIGGSMGGYASLLFSIKMGLRAAISIHPQINYKSVCKYNQDYWKLGIEETGKNFLNLEDVVHHTKKLPIIYIEHGTCEADLSAANTFINEARKKECFLINRKTASTEHNTDNPSKTSIESLIQYIENLGYIDEYIK